MGQGGFPKMPEIKLPRISGKLVLAVIGVVVLLVGLFTSFYTVGSDETAVIQRFGAYIGTADQGLHFKLPFFIDNATNVKTTFTYQEEFGFRTVKGDVQSEFTTNGEELESERQSLTGDLYVVAVEWYLNFKVLDPYNYLFKVKDVEGTLRAASEAAIKEIVGDYTVDQVITSKREDIAEMAMIKTQEIMDSYFGEDTIFVERINLRNVNPPTKAVQAAFKDVTTSMQKMERMIEEAEREYNAAIDREQGEKDKKIRQAEGQRQYRINVANGEAEQFKKILKEYRTSPQVTRQRLYLETLSEILPTLGRKIIVDDNLEGLIQLLNLQEGLSRGGTQ